MAEEITVERVVALAEDVRALLRRADALGPSLGLTGIHLAEALQSLIEFAPSGMIADEPVDR